MIGGALNVLVFPCGSEIGLEIARALKYSRHVNLIGASSVPDHGKFVYPDYIGDIPFADDPGFGERLQSVVSARKVDLIYPTMDSVIALLKKLEPSLCKVVAPSLTTAEICLSKRKTYERVKGKITVPRMFSRAEEVNVFPVFVKPDIGYGSRGARKIADMVALIEYLRDQPDALIMEFLPGREFTVDCFTDRRGHLQFTRARERSRVLNGVSASTQIDPQMTNVIMNDANQLSRLLQMRGSWFFQVKLAANGLPVLMEVACRFGGSSALHRVRGVNFPLLSIYDAMDMDVSIIENNFEVVMDRALDTVFKINLNFEIAYVDFDDTIVCSGILNHELVGVLYRLQGSGCKLVLISKHIGNLKVRLRELRLSELFDEVIHLRQDEEKFNHMQTDKAIFIDDSFAERRKIYTQLGIPVFAPDAALALSRIQATL